MAKGYVSQLLPSLTEARVLRKALADYTNDPDNSPEDIDLAWAMLAKLTRDMADSLKD